MAIAGGTRFLEDLLALLEGFRKILRPRQRCANQQQKKRAHHFDPSGKVNAIKVEPPRQVWSGNKGAS